jgi:hypothetical protein
MRKQFNFFFFWEIKFQPKKERDESMSADDILSLISEFEEEKKPPPAKAFQKTSSVQAQRPTTLPTHHKGDSLAFDKELDSILDEVDSSIRRAAKNEKNVPEILKSPQISHSYSNHSTFSPKSDSKKRRCDVVYIGGPLSPEGLSTETERR